MGYCRDKGSSPLSLRCAHARLLRIPRTGPCKSCLYASSMGCSVSVDDRCGFDGEQRRSLKFDKNIDILFTEL